MIQQLLHNTADFSEANEEC